MPMPRRSEQLGMFLFLSIAVLPAAFAQSNDTTGVQDIVFNNLFTDLTPLLALFGDEVTKQFLSQSIGWPDHIIFAMCPLGIITAVVSVIRVAGGQRLKGLIGRAREPRSAVEAELMSSTSKNVCELYGEQGLVRVVGQKPCIQQYLIDTTRDNEKIAPIAEYFDRMYPKASISQDESDNKTSPIDDNEPAPSAQIAPKQPPLRQLSTSQSTRSADSNRPLLKRAPVFNTSNQKKDPRLQKSSDCSLPPNMQINISITANRWREPYASALCGVVVQSAVLVFGALATYYWRWTKAGAPVENFAFPMACAGTVSVCIGLSLCAYFIDASTDEEIYKRKRTSSATDKEAGQSTSETLSLVWLQKDQRVGEMHFQPQAIFGNRKRRTSESKDAQTITDSKEIHLEKIEMLRTSHPRNENSSNVGSEGVKVSFIVVGTIVGYIFQLMGFHAMHSSISLAQFLGTLFMTALRAWTRRDLSTFEQVHKEPLNAGFEKEQLAMHIGKCHDWKVKAGFEEVGTNSEVHGFLAQRIMALRTAMTDDSAWVQNKEASSVSQVINVALTTLLDETNTEKLRTPVSVSGTKTSLSADNRATSSSDAKQTPPTDGQNPPSSDNLTTPPANDGPIPSLQEVLLDTTTSVAAEKERGMQINAILSLWCLNPNPAEDESNTRFFVVCKATPEHYLRCLKWIVCTPERWFTVRGRSRTNPAGRSTTAEGTGGSTEVQMGDGLTDVKQRRFGIQEVEEDCSFFGVPDFDNFWPQKKPNNTENTETVDSKRATQGSSSKSTEASEEGVQSPDGRIEPVDSRQHLTEGSYIAYRYPNHYSQTRIQAQHLFSVLLGSMAKENNLKILSDVKFRRNSDDKPLLTIEGVDKIANLFVRRGLGSYEEACVCMIPALAHFEKLPKLSEQSGDEAQDDTGLYMKDLVIRYYGTAQCILHDLLAFANGQEKVREEIIGEILDAEADLSADPRNRRIVTATQAQTKKTNAIGISATEGLENVVGAILKRWISKGLNDSQKADVENAVRLAAENKQIAVLRNISEKFKPSTSCKSSEKLNQYQIALSSVDSNGNNIFHWIVEKGDLDFLKELLVIFTGKDIDPEEQERKRAAPKPSITPSGVAESTTKPQGPDPTVAMTQAQSEAPADTQGQDDMAVKTKVQDQAATKPQYIPRGLNAESDMGRTPLTLAIFTEKEAIVQLLLAYGADLWTREEGGNSQWWPFSAALALYGVGADRDVSMKILKHVINFATASEVESWINKKPRGSHWFFIMQQDVEQREALKELLSTRGVSQDVIRDFWDTAESWHRYL